MQIDVYLLNTETDERAVYHDDYEYLDKPDGWSADEAIDYMWGEGNYSCDCNRAIFFAIATGRDDDPDDDDKPCGDGGFEVEKIVERGTDRIIYRDDSAYTAPSYSGQ